MRIMVKRKMDTFYSYPNKDDFPQNHVLSLFDLSYVIHIEVIDNFKYLFKTKQIKPNVLRELSSYTKMSKQEDFNVLSAHFPRGCHAISNKIEKYTTFANVWAHFVSKIFGQLH